MAVAIDPKKTPIIKMEKSIIYIFTSFIAGSITTLFGGILAHIFSERRDRLKEFNHAVAEFRNAFLEQVLFLKDEISDEFKPAEYTTDIYTFLTTRIVDSIKAIELFKLHLSNAEKIGIKQAWNNYCYPNGTPETPDERKDFPFIDYRIPEYIDSKHIALQNLLSLLSFAKFK